MLFRTLVMSTYLTEVLNILTFYLIVCPMKTKIDFTLKNTILKLVKTLYAMDIDIIWFFGNEVI